MIVFVEEVAKEIVGGASIVQDMMDPVCEGLNRAGVPRNGRAMDGLSHPTILLVANFEGTRCSREQCL